jgi:hypothetical protein
MRQLGRRQVRVSTGPPPDVGPAEAHGGDLWVESPSTRSPFDGHGVTARHAQDDRRGGERGVTFVFRLPVAR